SLATDEAGDLWRQVGRRFERARRREVGRQARDQELEQALRAIEVLQPVFAELAQRGAGGEGAADERGRRGRKDDLAAVRSGGDSSRAVDVDADVVVATQRAFAGVQAHADTNATGGFGPGFRSDGALGAGRRAHGRGRAREYDEEGVAFGRDLNATARDERPSEALLVTL